MAGVVEGDSGMGVHEMTTPFAYQIPPDKLADFKIVEQDETIQIGDLFKWKGTFFWIPVGTKLAGVKPNEFAMKIDAIRPIK